MGNPKKQCFREYNKGLEVGRAGNHVTEDPKLEFEPWF